MFFSEKFVCSWDWWTPRLPNATLCPIYLICAGKQVLFELQFHSTLWVSEGPHDSTHLTILAWAHRDQPLTHGPLGAVVAHGQRGFSGHLLDDDVTFDKLSHTRTNWNIKIGLILKFSCCCCCCFIVLRMVLKRGTHYRWAAGLRAGARQRWRSSSRGVTVCSSGNITHIVHHF